MKKIYNAPSTIVVKIELQRMIAESPASVTLSKDAGEVTSSDGIGSRQGNSLWDDEDDY